MGDAYVTARGLSKRFGNVAALDAASLEVSEGERLALLGPSGCGKTTLLRILCGLDVPDAGEVAVAGEILAGPGVFVAPERRRVGLVFQDWALFPHLTVRKNVAFGLSKEDISAGRIEEALEMVGLAYLADRYPNELSGGQAQRVALARALAPRPRVLLFDEPFSNLDTELRIKVRTEVAALMTEVGMTSIFVTHDQEEAFVLGDRVAVMREGRIVQSGPPSEVYEFPVTPWVARFVGETNLFEGVGSGAVVTTPVGRLRLTEDRWGPCCVVVRPEHLLIGNGQDGVVRSVEFYGHDTSYEVSLNGMRVKVRGMAAPRFSPGDRVSVSHSGPQVVAFGVDELADVASSSGV